MSNSNHGEVSRSNMAAVARRAGWLAVLITLAPLAQLWAPKLLGPPSKAMYDRPGAIVVGKVVEKEASKDDEKMRVFFRRKGSLHETSPKKFWLEVPSELAAEMQAGDQYVLAINEFRRALFNKYVYEKDPLGPRLVPLPAVGPAAFRKNDDVLLLVKARQERVLPASRLAAALSLLEGSEPMAVRFAAAELFLDDELISGLEGPAANRFVKLLSSGEYVPVVENYLIRAGSATKEPTVLGAVGAKAVAVLKRHDAEVELASDVPALLVQSLQTASAQGLVAAVEPAVKHLASNNPGVGKAALKTLQSLDLEKALDASQAARDQRLAHPETLRVIRPFLASHGRAPKLLAEDPAAAAEGSN